jgi:hypothetical protein
VGLQLVGFYPPLDLVGRLAPVHHLDLVLETSVRTGAGDLPPLCLLTMLIQTMMVSPPGAVESQFLSYEPQLRLSNQRSSRHVPMPRSPTIVIGGTTGRHGFPSAPRSGRSGTIYQLK